MTVRVKPAQDGDASAVVDRAGRVYGYGGRRPRLADAADPTMSPWRLALLAGDPDPRVRMAVAANPSASALTRLRLRHDDDPRVRAATSPSREADR